MSSGHDRLTTYWIDKSTRLVNRDHNCLTASVAVTSFVSVNNTIVVTRLYRTCSAENGSRARLACCYLCGNSTGKIEASVESDLRRSQLFEQRWSSDLSGFGTVVGSAPWT